MTPAQVAHIMSLVNKLKRFSHPIDRHEAAEVVAEIEAALRDAPQAEPVAWHVNFRGSSHLLTSLESVDLTDCIVTPLYPEPRAPDNTLKDRLLAALERAAGAESALRRLADKTEPLTQTRGYHALVQVIYELQQDGNYSDEEGEETSALVELLRAIEATPSAPTAVEPRPCKVGGPCVATASSPCACRDLQRPQPPAQAASLTDDRILEIWFQSDAPSAEHDWRGGIVRFARALETHRGINKEAP